MPRKTRVIESNLVPTKAEQIEVLIQTFFLSNEELEYKWHRLIKSVYDAKQVYALCMAITRIC